MKKLQVLNSVQNSVSSIFSKEDVINLINSIEQEQQSTYIHPDVINSVIDDVLEKLRYHSRNVVDYDSVEFELSYDNRIEVTDVRIDYDRIAECVEEVLIDTFSPEDESLDADEVELREIERIEQDNKE